MSTLKCKCDSFEATFEAPPCIIFNCHCHSCIAVIKGIEARAQFLGTSMNSDEVSGAAMAIFKSNNVTGTKVDGAKIRFMMVGEDGRVPCPYCTECGTMLFNVWAPIWCAANCNAMTVTNGSPFESKCTPLLNVNSKHVFNKGKVPSQSIIACLGMLVKFIPLLTDLLAMGATARRRLCLRRIFPK